MRSSGSWVGPANRQEDHDEANRQVTDANTKLASEAARAQDLQDEIDGYKSQVDSANQDKEDALKKAQSYDDLLAAVNKYVSGDVSGASTAVAALDASDFDGNAKTLYDSMASAVGTSLFSQYYNTGATAYLAGDYTTAADQLQKAVVQIQSGKAPIMRRRCSVLVFPITSWDSRIRPMRF